MRTVTAPDPPAEQSLEPDTVELHVRNVPRSVWLKARQAALASRLRFGRYVIKLLEQAEPLTPPSPRLNPTSTANEDPSPATGGSASLG